jgi:energy-coupling factor transport system ATP-binding protein
MMRPRRSTLIALSALGALGFVVLRVVYRAVFGGAATGEVTLWELPYVKLSGPFSHIVLMGPVTLEGVLLAVGSALPFALLILVTGVVVSFIDPRNLVFLLHRIRRGRSLVTAFVIALATIPGLVDTSQRTRYFADVRGITRKRVLFVPFLEKTLERAVSIAKALQVRGLGSPQGSGPAAPSPGWVAECDSFAIPTRGVKPVSWRIPEGSLTLLTGATGSGKTTILEALAGVMDHPHVVPTQGELRVTAGPADIGYVPHDPRSLFLASTVLDEVSLGLVINGLSLREARSEAGKLLALWDLLYLTDCHPSEISEGEGVLVAVIAVLAQQPSLVLLDEPLAVLDRFRRDQFVTALAEYSRDTHATIVMTDHGHLSAGRWLGDTVQISPEGLTSGLYVPPPHSRPARFEFLAPEADVVFTAQNLTVIRGQRILGHNLCVEIRRGESVALIGDNGAGKTTLLEGLFASSGKDPSTVAYVPTNPADMFIAETVREELAFTDASLGLPQGLTQSTLESLLPGVWRGNVMEKWGGVHPRDLSRGQQTALAIALQMSHKPLVLALDEPTRGLDAAASEALQEVVLCVQETGTAIISASHDDDYLTGNHHRVLRLHNGALVPQAGGLVHG